MKLTVEQKKAIYQKLEDYKINLVSADDSSWDNIQLCSKEYFFEKLDEALENVNPDYEKGFEIMYEFFDSIADEQKEEVDKKLKECGL